MQATEVELAQATRIRDAATVDPDIDESSLTDWEYLQHALVAKDRVDKALERIRRSQELKHRYGIQGDGSVEAALRDLQLYQRLYPRFLLSLKQVSSKQQQQQSSSNNSNSGDSHTDDSEEATLDAPHVFCQDMAQVVKSRNEEAYAVRVRVLFWLLQAMHCNIPAMRSGVYLVVSVKNASLNNLSLEQDRRNKELYGGASYPLRIRRIYVWNTSFWIRWFYSLVRLMLRPTVRQRTHFCGNQVDLLAMAAGEAWSQDDLPTSWGGSVSEDDFWDTVRAKLSERYRNAANFSLPEQE